MPKTANNLINFTKAKLESLSSPPPGKRSYFYDVKGNGLHIMISSQGRKTFYIRRLINGKNEKHYIGPFPDLSIEKAREKAAMFSGAVAYGTNPAEQKRILRGEHSLEELFQEYLERHLQKSRKTWQELSKSFERYFEHWKDRRLSTITQLDAERLHNDLASKRGPYTANRAIELLRAMYNKAITWRLYTGYNPAIGITLYEEKPRQRVLQATEFEKLFKALDNEEQDFRDFVLLTLLTGARKSNVMAMSWEDINIKNGTWTIPSEQSKNKQKQDVLLTKAEIDILKRRFKSKDGDYVFPGTGKTKHMTDIKHAWTSFLGRAKIKDLHIHDLRRSLASWMASTGANVSVIRSALNHKDVKTTITVYAQANREAELAALETAHDTMFALGKKRRKSKKSNSTRVPNKTR